MKAIVAALFSVLALSMAGCGESSEDAYDRGYDDGYDEGIFAGRNEICDEIIDVAPSLVGRLSGC
jgi:hypothetical protein